MEASDQAAWARGAKARARLAVEARTDAAEAAGMRAWLLARADRPLRPAADPAAAEHNTNDYGCLHVW